MKEIFTMAHTHKRNARNELIYNSGGSVQKTLYSLSSDASEDEIHDLLLCNHSNLKTSSQHISAFDSLQQKLEEPLQTYNARYQSYYELAHEGLTITSNGSKVSCIHYAKSLYEKFGEELEGRFNQRLPDNLQDAFDRAMDFEPRILTCNASTSRMSMRSTTLMSAITTKNLRSTRLNTSIAPITKVRITIQITRKIKITRIIVPIAHATRTTTATMAATMASLAGTSGTRVTTQKYHPMWK